MASNISVGTKGWEDRINSSWRKSGEMLVVTGQLLNESKASTAHGEFTKMIKERLDFSEQTAQRLMAIARDPRLSNPWNFTFLPSALEPLYKLTKIKDDAEFDAAVQSGVINPKMRAKDVPVPRSKPKVTDAEYHDVTESPVARPADAVSTHGDDNHRVLTPQDDREGGDSVVTEPNLGRTGDGGPARSEPWGVEPGPSPADAPKPVIPGQAGGMPAAPREGMVAYWVDPHDPVSMFAAGLSMAMAANGLTPDETARMWPPEMPLLSEQISVFGDWLMDFEVSFRALHGTGNDAALQAAE